VAIAARFIVDVQSVISREKDPTEFGVVTIGAIHGGTAEISFPTPCSSPAPSAPSSPRFAPNACRDRTNGEGRGRDVGAPAPDIKILEGTKPVMNDPDVVAAVADVLKAALGDKFRIRRRDRQRGFLEFAGAGVPSMMFNIGVYDQERIDAARNGGPPIPSNHSPLFAPVPKPTIETGVTAMTLAVLSAFEQKARRK
jgi:hippurate hydrolase